MFEEGGVSELKRLRIISVFKLAQFAFKAWPRCMPRRILWCFGGAFEARSRCSRGTFKVLSRHVIRCFRGAFKVYWGHLLRRFGGDFGAHSRLFIAAFKVLSRPILRHIQGTLKAHWEGA